MNDAGLARVPASFVKRKEWDLCRLLSTDNSCWNEPRISAAS
jgi:hypothetical protein